MTRFYVDGSLDVMKPLDRGEEELFTIPARSKYGDGVIIVTNFGLAVHTHKTGAILDLSHSEISSIEDAKDGRLCIKWIESSGHEGSLDITTKGSDGAYERISAYDKCPNELWFHIKGNVPAPKFINTLNEFNWFTVYTKIEFFLIIVFWKFYIDTLM